MSDKRTAAQDYALASRGIFVRRGRGCDPVCFMASSIALHCLSCAWLNAGITPFDIAASHAHAQLPLQIVAEGNCDGLVGQSSGTAGRAMQACGGVIGMRMASTVHGANCVACDRVTPSAARYMTLFLDKCTSGVTICRLTVRIWLLRPVCRPECQIMQAQARMHAVAFSIDVAIEPHNDRAFGPVMGSVSDADSVVHTRSGPWKAS